jgi:hypothetical protein
MPLVLSNKTSRWYKKQVLDRSEKELKARLSAQGHRFSRKAEQAKTAARHARLTLSFDGGGMGTGPDNSATSSITANRQVLYRLGFLDLAPGFMKLGHSVWKLQGDQGDVVVERLKDETAPAAKFPKRKTPAMFDALDLLGYPDDVKASMDLKAKVAAQVNRVVYRYPSRLVIRGLPVKVAACSNTHFLVEYEGTGIRTYERIASCLDAEKNSRLAALQESAQALIATGVFDRSARQRVADEVSSDETLTKEDVEGFIAAMDGAVAQSILARVSDRTRVANAATGCTCCDWDLNAPGVDSTPLDCMECKREWCRNDEGTDPVVTSQRGNQYCRHCISQNLALYYDETGVPEGAVSIPHDASRSAQGAEAPLRETDYEGHKLQVWSIDSTSAANYTTWIDGDYFPETDQDSVGASLDAAMRLIDRGMREARVAPGEPGYTDDFSRRVNERLAQVSDWEDSFGSGRDWFKQYSFRLPGKDPLQGQIWLGEDGLYHWRLYGPNGAKVGIPGIEEDGVETSLDDAQDLIDELVEEAYGRHEGRVAQSVRKWTPFNGAWVCDFAPTLHGCVTSGPDSFGWELYEAGKVRDAGAAPSVEEAQADCALAAGMV